MFFTEQEKRQHWAKVLQPLADAGLKLHPGQGDNYRYTFEDTLYSTLAPGHECVMLNHVWIPKQHRGEGLLNRFIETVTGAFPANHALVAVIRPFELFSESQGKAFTFDAGVYVNSDAETERVVSCFHKHGFETVEPSMYMTIDEYSYKVRHDIPLCQGVMVRYMK